MPIFLSHTTATECWRSGRFDALLGGPSISKRHRPAGSIQVEDTASILAMDRLDVTYREALAFGSVREGEALACKPSAREVRELRTGAIVFTSDPTHLLVPGKRAAATIDPPRACALRRAARRLLRSRERRLAPLLAGAVLSPNGEPRFVSPAGETGSRAVRALHAATRRSSRLRARPAAHHRPSARSYLRRCEGMAGCSVASKALRYIAVASGSPMETALASFFASPSPRRLRASASAHELPHRSSTRQSGTSDKRYYLCDLFWPEANVAIEYDSDLEHTGSARIAEDAQRRNDLTALGITTITATREQVMDAGKLSRIAHQVGAMLNVRIRDERGWNPREREQLLRSLVTEHDLKASWTKARRISVSN